MHKGYTDGDYNLIKTIPRVLAETERVCSSVNLGTTKSGINMDAVADMGRIIKVTAEATADRDGLGCAKLVVFCNATEDNPFMAGAFHGAGEPETALNIGISGPGVVASVVRTTPAVIWANWPISSRTPHLRSPVGELVGRVASRRLGVPIWNPGPVIGPYSAVGDSVADILRPWAWNKWVAREVRRLWPC